MDSTKGNLLSSLPKNLKEEFFEEILCSSNLKIERVVSHGHISPKEGWFDQELSEWVIVLAGSGRILYEDKQEFLLSKGDYLNIPAHTKHKVVWTDPEKQTIWLAIHYS